MLLIIHDNILTASTSPFHIFIACIVMSRAQTRTVSPGSSCATALAIACVDAVSVRIKSRLKGQVPSMQGTRSETRCVFLV